MRALGIILFALSAAAASAQNEADVLMRIGQEHFVRGELATAEQAYLRLSAMSGYPEVVGVSGLVNILTVLGRPEEGLALFRQHAQKSGNLEFVAMAAFHLAQQNQTEAARSELAPLVERLRQGGELNARTLSVVAFTERRIGDFEPALAAARQATDRFRAEGNARWKVMGRVTADILENLGRDLEASSEYELQVNRAPDDAPTLNDFALFLAVRGKQMDKALGYSRHSLELNPGDPLMLDTLGFILLKMGRADEAADTLVRAWRGRPNITTVRAHLAQALSKTANRSSLQDLLDALQTEPTAANTSEINRLLAAAGR